jgi:O-antigen/teichoic acid export membrane protein
MGTSGSSPGRCHPPVAVLTANSLLRLSSLAIRSLLILGMAVWLQPGELGLYAIIAATLTLTAYFYGLDFQTFSMRELSTGDLAGARLRVRDQFAALLLIYAIGSPILALVLRQFGLEPRLIALVVPMAVVQHASLELYRVLTRLGRPVAGTTVLLIRDSAWVPLCLLVKLLTGELSLTQLLAFWLAGSVASALYGMSLLIGWLPSSRQRIDVGWLATGIRTGLRMLAGTLSLVALFSVDRMIFAKLSSPDELGAYALFALGCTSVQGLFETAILPSFWAPLLQAAKDKDEPGYRHAEHNLTRACLGGAIIGGMVTAVGMTVLAWLLPHPAYAANLHLLYYLVPAYSLLTLTNIPHYRLFAARRDSLIVAANMTAFVSFLLLVSILVHFDRLTAVPLALALACAALFTLKWTMARRAGPVRSKT